VSFSSLVKPKWLIYRQSDQRKRNTEFGKMEHIMPLERLRGLEIHDLEAKTLL
jgi:hypothetical protein